MRYYELFEESTPQLSYYDLIGKYPQIVQDLKDFGKWLSSDPKELRYLLTTEPMTRFEPQAKEMLGTFDEFPNDERRTNKIIKILKSGGIQLPIFYDANDNFIMEGRHRIVAFYLLGYSTVPGITAIKI
jgi:hypothetical protein